MIEIKPNDALPEVSALFKKGMAALEHNNPNYALDMFEAALEIQPELLEARIQLLKTAARAVAGPTPIADRLKNGVALYSTRALLKKNPIKALGRITRLLRSDPLNSALAKAGSQAATAAGLQESALQILATFNNIRPNEPSVLEALAELYQQSQMLQQEYECREALLRLKPEHTGTQKKLNDAAARLSLEQSGLEQADSVRDILKDS